MNSITAPSNMELVFGLKPEWRELPVAGLPEGATARVEFRHRQSAVCRVFYAGALAGSYHLQFAPGRQSFTLAYPLPVGEGRVREGETC
jgi:hypothetical protein